MAAWLKMGVDLPEKPEVWQIASRCSLDPDAVVGKLLKVWRWFDSHTENGNAAGVTVSIIDHVATATGFGDAMVACGWLEATEDGLSCQSLIVTMEKPQRNGHLRQNASVRIAERVTPTVTLRELRKAYLE